MPRQDHQRRSTCDVPRDRGPVGDFKKLSFPLNTASVDRGTGELESENSRLHQRRKLGKRVEHRQCMKKSRTKVIRSRSVFKNMVAAFVSKAGQVARSPPQHQRIVAADWYTTICLLQVIAGLRKTKSERRIILRHDNANHSPYRPDLSANDIFTFPKIKNCLGIQRFQSSDQKQSLVRVVGENSR
ncbi:hypothetical protein Trydic_g764 [Trypoxylus dichotomus]